MELLNVDLVEHPVTISAYQSLEFSELPKIILGFEIKNQLDEKRFVIKPEYNPQRITHFCQTDTLEPIFLYGVELHPTVEMCGDLLQALNGFCCVYVRCKSVEAYIKQYKSHLEKYGLTCDDCYRYLRDGLYPIDMKHLPDLALNDKNLPISDLSSMLELSKEQWYLNMGGFHIYVLGACGAYYFNT